MWRRAGGGRRRAKLTGVLERRLESGAVSGGAGALVSALGGVGVAAACDRGTTIGGGGSGGGG